MKVVIIGGGIAGLTLGILLRKKNIETVINERLENMPVRGHSFLMHTDGLKLLKELNCESRDTLPGTPITAFTLFRPSGKEIKHQRLDSWKCMKRVDLLKFLKNQFPENQVKEGRDFSHFMYEDGKAIAAVFLNGKIEYGDIFVGADGANSCVRRELFGDIDLRAGAVKEIVGVVNSEKLGRGNTSTFTKYQDATRGLAFGMIPTSENEFVWFMQYDSRLNDLADSTPEELKMFCKSQLKNFPDQVQEVLNNNDFSTSYIWNTRDFDLLPAFHKSNVVLLGDAGHLSLPFTSAGTTNAIIDAKIVAENLFRCESIETAFTEFYCSRSAEINSHIQLGRKLSELFLNPVNQSDDKILVPLIGNNDHDSTSENSKPIQVTYFTDPICSTCWIIQPALRKMQLEYGKFLNIHYVMGGLLPSWNEYSSGSISRPSDAALLWEEVCVKYNMPLDGDIWHEDPLNSSYPPSIAFKAAQMQDKEMALIFLRRIKEMVFVEKRNIIKWEYLQEAAFEAGLDTARLRRDYDGEAKELFNQDLLLGKELGVTSFPTMIFSAAGFPSITIKGFQHYERYEEIIVSMLCSGTKEQIDTSPKTLFTRYPCMVDQEFALLSNISIEEATVILNNLFEQGFINRENSKNGILWKARYAQLEAL